MCSPKANLVCPTTSIKHTRWLSSPNLSILPPSSLHDNYPLQLDTPAIDDDNDDNDSVLSDPPSTADNIRALVRIKPSSVGSTERTCLSVDGASVSLTPPIASRAVFDKKTFSLDGILPESTSQEEVFQAVAVPLVANVLEGYNGTIFAYGQTGSGKTYTMQTIFTCTCSYLEIYNEKIFDLLDESMTSEAKLLREDAVSGIFVQDLLDIQVHTPSDALDLLTRGTNNRTVGATAMNRESSRSHSVFMVKLVQKLKDDSGLDIVRKSTLHLVDLAGSEKQSATGATGTRLKEVHYTNPHSHICMLTWHVILQASQINKSLSALSNVITGLVDVSKGLKRHIHYRDSKLTFLLRDALGGNSKTTVVATVSAHDKWFHETMSTLQFVQRVKCIKNNAKKYEDDSAVIARLEMQVRELQRRVDDSAVPRVEDMQAIQQKADELSAMKVNNEKLELVVTLLNGKVTTTQEELHATQQKLNDVELALSQSKAECESLLVKQTLLECKLTGQGRNDDVIAPMETVEGTTEAQTIKSLQDIVAELHSQLIAAENARGLAEKRLKDATNQKKAFSLFKGILRRRSSGGGRKWWQRWKKPLSDASNPKLLSPSSARHLRSPSSPSMERVSGASSRPCSPGGLERTSSIPRLNSSSKVHTLARKFELKIETNAAAAAASSSTTSAGIVHNNQTTHKDIVTSPVPATDEPQTVSYPVNPNEESIRALVRIRPSAPLRDEIDPSVVIIPDKSVRRCLEPDATSINIVNFKQGADKRQFSVDGLLLDTATQDDVFKAVGMRVVDNAVDGYNGSIFAYGQTGSGKTHTMQGDMTEGSAERGVIPRILYYMFERLTASQTSFDMTCSYLEIYNEKIYDLLDVISDEPKYIREDATLGLFVQDLVEMPVASPRAALQVLDDGGQHRTVGCTAMNRESSRSHSVFTIKLTQRLDEAGRHVPYRDSKLTFLLRDALGGNSKTTLIATVSSEDKFSNETLSTLQFMQRAKHIKTIVNKNEDTRTVIKQLQGELVGLRGQLDAATATIDADKCKRAALQQLVERLQLQTQDKAYVGMLETKVEALEGQLTVQTAASEALHDAIKTHAQDAAHAHDEVDECQRMLKQVRLEFERARQTHTSDACLVATLREELVKRDNDHATQSDAWSQKLAALQADVSSAATHLAAKCLEADGLKQLVSELKLQLDDYRRVSMEVATATAVDVTPSHVTPCMSIASSLHATTSSTPPISEDGQVLLSPRVCPNLATAIGSFSIPASMDEAHRDLQLQHDQLLHVMQKLDGLRNSKKFLQHALQTTLTDNAEMVQSLKKLQRNTALDALQQTLAGEKKARKQQQQQSFKLHSLEGDDESDIPKEDELKQLAADKVALTSRLKATQAKVGALEDQYGRVTQALLAAVITLHEDVEGRHKTWRALQQEPVELSHTPFYEGLVENMVDKVKQLTSTVDNQVRP
ncbi:hypothetical protein DYB37_007546 [Aphanomyces astaci]|uniref:Kinesin motor domain-containing protein n=1 Tax=Aphanomyces astaci TaxID=112090 RepID=A0A3R7AMH9_APHAT|nr:hypothetical protein DYB35_005674 [Aphanomyces astaci]RHZ23168.1 hypothetical protein DYB37_007546 [Aphanomyces astaci]